jgi:hypothetical protein
MELKMSVCTEAIAILISTVAYLTLRHLAELELRNADEKSVDSGKLRCWKLWCYSGLASAAILHLASLILNHA